MTPRGIRGVRRAGRVQRLREQIDRLRRQQYGPAIVVALYENDDSPAHARWVEALDEGVRQVGADSVIVVVSKLGKRPADVPAPWAAPPSGSAAAGG
jgi:hypothetical protein